MTNRLFKTILTNAVRAALMLCLIYTAGSIARAQLPLNPTAPLPPPDRVIVAGSYFNLGGYRGGDGVEIAEGQFYGVFGAYRLNSRVEINGGVGHLSIRDTLTPNLLEPLTRTGPIVGGKVLVVEATNPTRVSVAVGGGYSRPFLNNSNGFVVFTRPLFDVRRETPVTAHVGVRFDHYRAAVLGNSSAVSVFGTVEVPLVAGFSVAGEL